MHTRLNVSNEMSKASYNAITKYAGGGVAKHRNITNVPGFIEYMSREYLANTIFFYDSLTRQYVGYWKYGLSKSIH